MKPICLRIVALHSFAGVFIISPYLIISNTVSIVVYGSSWVKKEWLIEHWPGYLFKDSSESTVKEKKKKETKGFG